MDEEKKEATSKSSNTNLYIVFLIVLVLVAGGALYVGRKSGEAKMIAFYQSQPKPSGMPRPSGPPSMKGQKFSDTNVYSNAVLVYPGALSEEAKAVLTGWQFNAKTLSDGITQIDMVPVGSEATEGDMAHTFILKTGDKLYFVDLNPNDDQPGEDMNKNDDIGIVVDTNGIVQ